tara:strand:+ start:10606 stop:11055 length:450 start_codon:yes stop_codon:yes gene_type:complete
MDNTKKNRNEDMGVINKNQRQLTLYYSSETSVGKQTYGYVSASEKQVLAIDISKTKVTGTQWADLAENLGIGISDLINKKHPDFTKTYGTEDVDMDDHDWLKVLQQHPEVLKFPIAINGEEYRMLKDPSDFMHVIGTEGRVDGGTETPL